MEFGVDTRDVALMTEGAAALQVPMAAWLTHTCCCPEVFMTELIVDELGAPSDCCAGPLVERATAGEVAAVMTPPATLSMVVPGFERWEVAGTDFNVLSDIFISDACPPGAAWVNSVVFCPEMTFNVCCPWAEVVLTPRVPWTTEPVVSCFPDVCGDGWPTKKVP